ncbi:VCBS repeat-containing protein [Paenibacillus oenotherae]|uniref:VCBS repeat-containing protein n=1 Tax=Paenibacillus oenotherae TaxID=1435645 RepID=A0ABS7D7H8_9BACL|nr:VCBS repeat-containing protein [Paenibacillus oenotherae]MBW7475889.1 VCBS repeat-containing protein [Paenibacillus oenotherae]
MAHAHIWGSHGMIRNGTVVLDVKLGDVNGDRTPDQVYLTGNPTGDTNSSFVQNIQLVVVDGRSGARYTSQLKNNAGYNARLFLGDFTGDRVDNILVSIDSGGSGGFTYNYIYSFMRNMFRELYNNEWFYETYSDASVFYEDNYRVRIVNRSLQKEYLLDISKRDPSYLSELYDANGKLKKPVEGSVMGVGGAYPIDLQGDRIYELWPFQRVIGLYNADTLGYLQTPLSWNANTSKFIPMYQWASVNGSDI